MSEKEYTVKLKVVPNNRGRKYDRLEVVIELPGELKNWQFVPVFLYGYEISKDLLGHLIVPMRRAK